MIPIAGWGSTITAAMNGDDGRVIAALYKGVVSATASTSAPIQWNTKVYDTHNCVSTGSSWRFVSPVSKFYTVSCTSYTPTSSVAIDLYKNGTLYSSGAAIYAGFLQGTATFDVELKAGEYIDIRPSATVTMDAGTNYSIAIHGVAGNAIASMATGAGRTAFTSITAEYTSASTTWVEVLSLAIIPKYASSKICIRSMLTLTFYTDNSILVSARILKNGTPIATFTNIAGVGIGTPIAPTQATPLEWTEDAGSVDTRTYSIEFRRESYAGGYGGTAYVNSGGNRLSTLKLIEEIQ